MKENNVGDSGVGTHEAPKREDTHLMPTNTYSASKAACEAMLNAYRVSYHLPTVVLRMNNVYGPRQWDTKVIPLFIREALAGNPYTLMGDGSVLRSWMYVDDCCRGEEEEFAPLKCATFNRHLHDRRTWTPQ